MSDVTSVRRRFMDALRAIAEGEGGPEDLAAGLRAALLDFGSETPDNLACAGRIEVGAADTEVGPSVGLKLRGRDVLLSDLAHTLEDGSMPASLKRAFPDLAPEDWQAFARLTTLIYSLLDRKV